MTKKREIENIMKSKITKNNSGKNQIINNNIGKNGVIKSQRLKRQSERKKELQRNRNTERDRRARGSRKYGQAKLKHAKKGVISCVIAGSILITLGTLLATAYMSGGKAAGYIGGIGFVAMILSGVGIYCAVRGFKEREKDYLTCKIGIGCNIFFLIGFIGIFCRGLF